MITYSIQSLPYVFWHRFWSRKHKCFVDDRYQCLNRFTERLCEKAKVKRFGFHQLRHLAASILKQNGHNIASLQKFLRHESQKTTEIYAGFIDTSTKEQTDYLDDFWTEKLMRIVE